jgi:predicted DsbA family dithiol-disulfide isomerase
MVATEVSTVAQTASATRLRVDVYSDVVCPWCFIGLKKLRMAEGMVAPDLALDISWMPFQLDSTIPAEGYDHASYLSAKFGSAEQFKAARERVAEEGRKVGIPFAFERIAISPNTLKAHALSHHAHATGVAPGLVEALFAAYFIDGRDLSDDSVLAEIAEENGMDGGSADAALQSAELAAQVSARIALASRMGINSVPCFVIEQRYAVMGAQAPEALADAFRQIAQAKADGAIEAAT